MFGLIHESIRLVMIKTYGEEFWQKCMIRAGFECGKENIINHHYPDEDTYAIVESVSALAKISKENVWELYGKYFVEYNMNNGWDEMLRCMSPNLKGFLNNLDSLHYFIDHVVYKANLRGPSFRCEETSEDTIVLHYFSSRSNLYPIVQGMICEISRKIFKMEINMSVAGRTQRSIQLASGERVEEHLQVPPGVVTETSSRKMLLNENTPKSSTEKSFDSNELKRSQETKIGWQLCLNQNDFTSLLPYHFIMDRDCKLVQYGKSLLNHVTWDLLQLETPVIRIFEIYRPQIPFDFENILNFINGVFVLQVRNSPLQVHQQQQQLTSSDNPNCDVSNTIQAQHLKLKGQMFLLNLGNQIIYACSPYVTSIPDLLQYGLRLSSIPSYDATRDLILLNQQRLNDVEDNLQLEANNEQLKAMARDLEAEKEKTDALLREVLPPSVAEQLMNGASVDAQEYPESTVMFSDIPAFHTIVPHCKPTDVVVMLNDLFVKFDHLIILQNVYKVETIGDSYMTVAGVPEFVENHCEKICHVALGMIWEARTVLDPVKKEPLLIRCGIHSGNIVTGVVGQKMPRYCLFGDTVNTSARMESYSPPGCIHCTEAAVTAAQKTGRFDFVSRGLIMIKGKGLMETFFLKKSYKKSIWEIINQNRDENKHSIDGYSDLFKGIENDLKGLEDKTNSVSKTCSII